MYKIYNKRKDIEVYMNKFLAKHAGTIILVLISLVIGGSGSKIFDRAFPDASAVTKDFIKEIVVEAIQDEIAPIKADIKQIKEQNQVFADDIAEEWVRVIRKQYLKVQTNRDDLSWSDVEYALSKWVVLPDSWITPELTKMIEYLELKYEGHINNGG